MSSTLREQLLKAGLVTEADVRRANQPPPRPPKRKPAPTPEASRAARESQAAKTARDQELNRRQKEKADRKARIAEIEQWVEQHRLPPLEGEDFYSFVDHQRIARIVVNPAMRAGLSRGELAIVRHQRHYAVVPAAAATRIRERDATRIVAQQSQPDAAPEGAGVPAQPGAEDPYKDFPVPDDLIW
jgi:uncharacterized protein YaiL (DUF2058 family)